MEKELTQEKMEESMNEMQVVVKRNIPIYNVSFEDLIVCSWQEFNLYYAYWISNQNLSWLSELVD